SLQEVTFPRLPAGSVVTTPYALLILVSTLPLAPAESAEFFLHTDYNLYRVILQRGENSRLQTRYLLHDSDGQSTRYQGKRQVETIQLQVEATAQAPDKPDFEILGLRGEVSILLDSETRLPLRVIGTAPRIGKTHLDLIAATLPDDDAH
ncbi:MAG: hypothetical protein O7F73_07720, partial [Gammaproteobacteria bacterium]|nr:hypothetical protein [Gammaproteobacteria bacterium]